jgi:hypothetical protein
LAGTPTKGEGRLLLGKPTKGGEGCLYSLRSWLFYCREAEDVEVCREMQYFSLALYWRPQQQLSYIILTSILSSVNI